MGSKWRWRSWCLDRTENPSPLRSLERNGRFALQVYSALACHVKHTVPGPLVYAFLCLDMQVSHRYNVNVLQIQIQDKVASVMGSLKGHKMSA